MQSRAVVRRGTKRCPTARPEAELSLPAFRKSPHGQTSVKKLDLDGSLPNEATNAAWGAEPVKKSIIAGSSETGVRLLFRMKPNVSEKSRQHVESLRRTKSEKGFPKRPNS